MRQRFGQKDVRHSGAAHSAWIFRAANLTRHHSLEGIVKDFQVRALATIPVSCDEFDFVQVEEETENLSNFERGYLKHVRFRFRFLAGRAALALLRSAAS